MRSPFIPRACQILTLAGSDPGGGAGIQADLKTIMALGGYGWSVITALTVQNTQGVESVALVAPSDIQAQLQVVLADADLKAIKIGMLGTAETMSAVLPLLCDRAHPCPIIVDPICVASSGRSLLTLEGRHYLLDYFSEVTSLLTPNLAEACLLASDLSGQQIVQSCVVDVQSLTEMANILATRFPAILFKGGHGTTDHVIDRLFVRDQGWVADWTSSRLIRHNTHGTGCTLSSAIACYLGAGYDLSQAVGYARDYLWETLFTADHIMIGRGQGGLNHFSRHFDVT